MALSMKQTSIARPTLGVARRPVVCQAVKPESESRKVPVAIASVLAAMMMSGAFVPDEALAARSGGRAGGGNFSSRRSSAPAARSYNTAPRVSNTTVVVGAPPVFSPFGFGGYGMGMGVGGYGMGMPMGMGYGMGFGSILQLFFVFALVSVVFNVVKSDVKRRFISLEDMPSLEPFY
eukprot:gene18169-24601_t